MKTYYEPVYKANVTVFLESDPDKAQKKIEKIIGEGLENVSFGAEAKTVEYVSDDGAQKIIVWLKRRSAKNLVHELVHVVEYVFERRRIPFSLDSSENIAYYMEHLYETFENIIKKSK